MKKIKYKIYILACMMLLSASNISAKVTFNQSQASSDVKSLLDPISNVLMGLGFGATLISVCISYLSYMGKDDGEKENMPFVKTVKKHVVAYVFLGLVGTILKWFSIS